MIAWYFSISQENVLKTHSRIQSFYMEDSDWGALHHQEILSLFIIHVSIKQYSVSPTPSTVSSTYILTEDLMFWNWCVLYKVRGNFLGFYLHSNLDLTDLNKFILIFHQYTQ